MLELAHKPCEISFFNNVGNAREVDGFLSFEKKIPSTKLKKLLLRESYRTIASKIKPGKNKTIITGTPGVGKSLFLIYLLWKLVKEGKRVLFIYDPNIIYYDGLGGVFELINGTPSIADHIFWSKDLWCLFDAKLKSEADLKPLSREACAFVLSTSPRRDMVQEIPGPSNLLHAAVVRSRAECNRFNVSFCN